NRYDEHGRHQIYAGGKKVELNTTDHTLVLDPEAVAAGKQKDLDEMGIAKNAREEKLRAQRQKAGTFTPEDAKMAELYRQHVLKAQPPHKSAGVGGKKKQVQDVLHKKAE